MKRRYLLAITLVPFLSFAAQQKSISIDDLMSRDPAACHDIKIDDNYPGILQCISILSKNSEVKLKSRLLKIRQDLTALGDADYTSSFENAQNSWEKYKYSQCNYITSGMERNGSAYQFHSDFCNAAENDRRLETLIGEPSTS